MTLEAMSLVLLDTIPAKTKQIIMIPILYVSEKTVCQIDAVSLHVVHYNSRTICGHLMPPTDQNEYRILELQGFLPSSSPECLCTTAPPLVPACTAQVV